VKDLLTVEDNMASRRKQAAAFLMPNERIFSLTSFPRLGTVNYTEPPTKPDGEASHSLYVSDNLINTHARFKYNVI
jgi:glutamate--cysteine ligase catalytic subunit